MKALRGSQLQRMAEPIPARSAKRSQPPKRLSRADIEGAISYERPSPEIVAALEAKAKRPAQKIIDGLKEAMAETKSKGGRPKTTGEPWKAEGISKALWYRRRAKSEASKGKKDE